MTLNVPEKEINDNYLVNLGFELNVGDEEPSKILPNKKNSVSRDPKILSQYDNTLQQQPIQQPSIQTVLQDQKSQNQTAIFHKDGQKINMTNESIIDWDQGSQLRKSMNRIKFQGLDRGRTLQSMKGKQYHQNNGGGVDILEESMIQEEVQIQNTNVGSQHFIHNKLKMVKSKHNTDNQNNFYLFYIQLQIFLKLSSYIYSNQNPIGIRKVSWLEFDSGQTQHQDGKSAQQLFNKQISKGSETNFDLSPPINQQENEIKQRIEARENSIISKKTNNNIDITRRKKRRKTTQLLQLFQGLDGGDTKSTKKVEKSILGNDAYSSSVYTTGGPSNPALMDSNNKEYNNADNNSVHVAHSYDGNQRRIQDIVHVHFEMDLDRYKSSKFYFPDYNLEVVLQKIAVYYEQVNDKKFEMREMKRTKTNLTLFDRIRQAKNPTIRGSFVDKSPSPQDND